MSCACTALQLHVQVRICHFLQKWKPCVDQQNKRSLFWFGFVQKKSHMLQKKRVFPKHKSSMYAVFLFLCLKTLEINFIFLSWLIRCISEEEPDRIAVFTVCCIFKTCTTKHQPANLGACQTQPRWANGVIRKWQSSVILPFRTAHGNHFDLLKKENTGAQRLIALLQIWGINMLQQAWTCKCSWSRRCLMETVHNLLSRDVSAAAHRCTHRNNWCVQYHKYCS